MTPRSTTTGALLVAALLAAGCDDPGFCLPEFESARTFWVNPSTDPAPDNATVVDSFATIQAALDAAGGPQGRATICVADGTYAEELRVPANTHLLAQSGKVRIRPPQTRRTALPTDVDRTLLTLVTGDLGPITIQGLDLRGAGLCVDVVGDGEALLRNNIVSDCAIGMRVRGGAEVTLRRTPLRDHALRGIDAVGSAVTLTDGSNLLRNGRPATWHASTTLLDAPDDASWAADLLAGRGALVARDATIVVRDAVIDESEFSSGVVTMSRGSLTLEDVVLGAQRPASTSTGFRAGEAGGIGPALALGAVAASLDRVVARTEALGLARLTGSGGSFDATNVSWTGQRGAARDPAVGPALVGDGDGSMRLRHVTLLGPEGEPGIALSGGPWDLEIQNTIVWGPGDGFGLTLPAGSTSQIQWSLFSDPSLAGDSIVTGQDPLLTDTAAGLVIDADSPARCAGTDLGVTEDLLGAVRPFAPGKLPDLGAIELQEPCP